MNLSDVELNRKCIINEVKVKSEKTKIRLMELGLVDGVEIMVARKSLFKKTLLIIFCHSCFTLKENLAREIEVKYA